MTSRSLKRIAIGIGLLVLLIAVAVGVLVATFDANRYKSVAVDWMQAKHQRQLVIDGPIELSFFPRLAVKVTKVRLSEQGRADEFAAIDDASLAVALLPLLKKELSVDRVTMRGARLNLLRDANGVRNIDDLLTPTTPATTEPGSPSSPSLRFDVSSVQLDDVRLHVRDDMSHLAGDIALVSFTSGRLTNASGENGIATPIKLRATAALTQPQVVNATVDGKTMLTIDTDHHRAALADTQLVIEGESAAIKALSLTLEGVLAWDGVALQAGPLQVTLKNATFAAASVTNSSLSLTSALWNPAAQRLELDGLKLALAGQKKGSPFEFGFEWPRLAVDPMALTGSAFTGRVKLGGATSLAGEFHSAAPTGRFDALRLPGFAMTMTGSTGPRQVEASVNADLTVNASAAVLAIDRLNLGATLTDPGTPAWKVGASGSARTDASNATWVLDGAINNNRFESRGGVSGGGRVPRVKANARFDVLNLNSLMAPAKVGDPATANTGTAPADTPVSFDALKAIDGEFTLEAGSLVFRLYKVLDAKVAASMAGGVLRVSRIAGRTWGGTVEGSGMADADHHQLALKLDASGVNVNALMRDVAGKDLLEGTGHVAADITSVGTSVGALRSNLAGSVAMQLRDGSIKGVNLARSFRQAQSALSLKQDTVSAGSAVEKTDFSELKVSARIAGGVAESDDLDARSPFIRLGGAGRFDIGRGRIDYTARASVIDLAAGQGGAGLDALRGVTVPVLLSGPFDAISWKIQWSGIAAAAIRNQLKDKLTERLGAKLGLPSPASNPASAPLKPKDELKEKLRGLFR